MSAPTTWTPVVIACTYGGNAGTWTQNSPSHPTMPWPRYGTFTHAKDPGFGPMSYLNIARAMIVEPAGDWPSPVTRENVKDQLDAAGAEMTRAQNAVQAALGECDRAEKAFTRLQAEFDRLAR
jgi:hypothetical protein